MNSLTIVIVAGFLVLGLLFMLYNIFFYLVTGVPYVRTGRDRITQILALIKEHESRPYSELTFMDLGSGLGHMLHAADKAGFKRVIGYELSPMHVLINKIWFSIVSSKAEVRGQNAFGEHLAEADVIYFFLTKLPMERLTRSIMENAKPGALVIGLGTALTSGQPIATRVVPKVGSTIYLYRTPL